MTEIKKLIAASVAEAIASFGGAVSLSEDDIFTMLEYPPDSSMGDVALPCF